MSFSSEAKDEICLGRIKMSKQKYAYLCALTLTTAALTISKGTLSIEYVSENHNVGKLISALAGECYDVKTSLMLREHERLKARNTVVLVEGEGCRNILNDANLFNGDGGHIPAALQEDDEQGAAFIRGLFLGAGSVTNPAKSYHLELVLRHESLAQEVLLLLEAHGLSARMVQRKSNFVVYMKEAERICDFLAYVGAVSSVLAFENTRVVRGIKNNLNRQSNFEDANMQKTAETAAQQIQDINYIASQKGLDTLPPRLRETAEARLSEPEAPLSELAQMLGVGKSGVNHRLKKLASIAEDLRMNE